MAFTSPFGLSILPGVLLVPLLRESLLPGETRPVDALGIDRDLAAYLGTLPEGTEVCTVTIASAVEVLSLIHISEPTRPY